MKNLVLSRIDRADRIYPLAARLPRPIRSGLLRAWTLMMKRRAARAGFPDRLTIFLTNRCNMQCRHCFLAGEKQPQGQEMSLQEYQAFFTRARGRLSQVLFTGGEPTLREDFVDILVAANRAGRCASASIFTNGFCRERILKVIYALIEKTSLVLSLQLSVDGMDSFHDANRGIKGALNRTLSTIEGLQKIRSRFPARFARLTAATAISRKNMDDLPDIINIGKKIDVLHSFGFVRGSKHSVFGLKDREALSEFEPADYNDYLTVEDMEKALEIIKVELWARHNHNLYYATNRAILETIKESLKAGRPQVNCMAGSAELTLLPDGAVARCEMLKSCASLRDFDWDLEALVASESFKNNYKKTAGCWCTHECAVGTSISYDTRLLNYLFDN